MANLQQEQQQLRAANGQKLALFGQHAQLRVLVDRSRRAFERVSLGAGGSPSSPVGGSAPTALPSALRVNNVPFFDLAAQVHVQMFYEWQPNPYCYCCCRCPSAPSERT